MTNRRLAEWRAPAPVRGGGFPSLRRDGRVAAQAIESPPAAAWISAPSLRDRFDRGAVLFRRGHELPLALIGERGGCAWQGGEEGFAALLAFDATALIVG